MREFPPADGYSIMASPKQSSSWQEMRRALSSKNKTELLNLIRNLYALRPEVKDFINARFVISAANLKPYQRTIQASLCPDATNGSDIIYMCAL